uniref:BolA-like protein 3 n=1 Tax=Ciona intestinalis TaxID=7719 RepID=H2XWV5_CIOIN
ASPTNGEAKIEGILKVAFPNSESIQVKDISGGCGDMYEVHIVSSDFKGKRVVQQHKLVNEALKTEVQKMHGLRIFTSVPSC